MNQALLEPLLSFILTHFLSYTFSANVMERRNAIQYCLHSFMRSFLQLIFSFCCVKTITLEGDFHDIFFSHNFVLNGS